ncbi:MAG: thioredoxin-disulfide reductase [Acidobacteriota bacterium]|nr:thioredoxin-disulfide reductase [Blastocatellia bacterium]MDW8412538.1 thioredoxin-disulfide reductase [Acidobacteriota bacterium]
MEKQREIIIVGSGPAGLTAAIYAARAGLNPLVAAGEVRHTTLPGGQLMLTTDVENYPGFPEGIQGPEMMHRFFEQAKRFGTEILNAEATQADFPQGGPFRLLVGQEWFTAKSVILAMGARAKWLGVPGEEEFRAKGGVSACATCDGPLPYFRNSHLIVVGGGDTAMEEALFLTKFAAKVTIVHRRDKLRASKVMQLRAMSNPKIEFLWNSTIVEYLGSDSLEAVRIKNTITGEEKLQPIRGVFVAIGHQPMTDFVKGIIDLDEQGYIITRNNVETNIEGVFAAGDVHDKHYRQAVTAAGFGCMAAISAERWLASKEGHH